VGGFFTALVLAAAAAEAAKFFKEQRSQDCLSGGPQWQSYGPLDTANGTLNPGRATFAKACITPESADPGGYPKDLPGYDSTVMNKSHLLARAFGGSAQGNNIVLLWAGVNQSGAMKRMEAQIIAAKAAGLNTLYYAQAIYSPLQGTGPGGTPYMPIAVYISWQISGPGQTPREASILNVQ
jgi:hypothetical protein